MSGIKPPELIAFYRSLRARGLNTPRLAAMLGTSRSHLTQVILGARSGGRTLPALMRLFTENECKLLEHRSTWRTLPAQAPKPCACGRLRQPWERHCPDCHRGQTNDNRPARSEMSPEDRRRANARSYLHVYIRRGLVKKQPCAACGCAGAEAHHHDYSRPLDVEWLCRRCHRERHGRPVAQAVMHVKCAWCSKDLGTQPCAPEHAYQVSHGLCPACMETHFPQFAEEIRSKQKEAHAA